MADSIYLDRDFQTNGITIPAGKVSTEDLKQLLPVGDGDKRRPMTDEEARATQQDLLARQGKYNSYMQGIHEKRDYTHNSGTMSVGGE